MDRFEAFETFVTVVDTGQFSAAARQLGCNNSVVSRRVAELEAHLGAQLLRRTTRRLSLTEAGRDFYERAVRLLAELQEAEQSVASGQRAIGGRLRFAAPLSFGLLHLPAILNDFAERHPELELEVSLDDREVNLVEEGIDLALRIGTLGDSTLVARPLAPIRRLLCASPAYLARYGTPRTPAELVDHRCLVYTNLPDPTHWRLTSPEGRVHSVRVSPRLRANNGDLLLAAAVEGLGICVQPTFLAYRALIEGRLVPLLTDYALPTATAHAIYPSRRFVPLRVRALVDHLVERIGAQPYWDAGLG